VQDLGRPGYQAIGVPVSGALDSVGLRLANALVGNPPGTPALEVLISGPTFEIAADTVRVALAGAGASLVIGAEKTHIQAGQSVTVPRGETVEVVVGRQSACCYLGVEGGIAVPQVLGSASTYIRAALGGLDGRALRSGDIVPLAMVRASDRAELGLSAPMPATGDQPIRVVLGPQQEYFTEEAIATLLDAEFRISASADRMGMRLDGPLLQLRRGWDIVPARGSRSCCSPTTRRPADTRRSPRSSRPICRLSGGGGLVTRCALPRSPSKPPRNCAVPRSATLQNLPLLSNP